jgi:GMP synthase (glutamine-hydrolysing)
VSQQPLAVLVTGEPVDSSHLLLNQPHEIPARRARGDFVRLIQEQVGGAWCGPWLTVDLRRHDALPEPEQLAGVIVTGSAAFLKQAAPWMDAGMQYLCRLVAAKTPTFGICFGHQMLGQALGGRVDRNPNGREIGTVLVEVLDTSCLLGPDCQLPFAAQTTHMDSVVSLPPGAQVLARSAQEPYAFVRFSEFAWGVQFHPEMDAEVMRCYIQERRATLLNEGIDPDVLLQQVTPTPKSAALLQRFVTRVVVARAPSDTA